MPPGCLTISCAHARAWEFFAESVYPSNEENFMSIKCTSITALNSKLCPGKAYPMGYKVPHNLKGNFFLKTNSKKPFGENNQSGKNTTCHDQK